MSNLKTDDYPKEFFLSFDANPFLLGRIVIISNARGFSVEVAIVAEETKKIYRYVETLYNISEEREALDKGIQCLSQYMKNESMRQSNS